MTAPFYDAEGNLKFERVITFFFFLFFVLITWPNLIGLSETPSQPYNNKNKEKTY